MLDFDVSITFGVRTGFDAAGRAWLGLISGTVGFDSLALTPVRVQRFAFVTPWLVVDFVDGAMLNFFRKGELVRVLLAFDRWRDLCLHSCC